MRATVASGTPTAAELASASFSLGSVFSALAAAVGALVKVVVLHTVVLGIGIVMVSFWAGYGVGLARGIAAAGLTLGVHVLVTPFLLAASGSIVVAATVRHLGVARVLLRAAVERAAASNSRIADENDYEALSTALTRAFDSLSDEVATAAPGRFRWIRRMSAQIGRRLVQMIGRYTLGQLELAHREGRVAPYRTMDEWLGSQIDSRVASMLAGPSKRLVLLLLIAQACLTTGVIVGVVKLLPLWGAARAPAPTYP
ncbi:MAG: hypothetical protein K2Q20_03090 [Phycisphaerales bacterium]|nr:hypothetical protein [Phycisphaerales bacterium]